MLLHDILLMYTTIVPGSCCAAAVSIAVPGTQQYCYQVYNSNTGGHMK